MLLQFSYMSVLFVYSRVIVVMNGTDDEAKAVDMSRYNGIMKLGDVGRLWIKKIGATQRSLRENDCFYSGIE